jgi:topoisomerase-4 subunit A
LEINKDGAPMHTLAQITSKISIVCPINKDYKYVIAQDRGYGFIVTGENLMTRQKAGKEMVSMTENSKLFQPLFFSNEEKSEEINFGVITTENKFLTYKLNNLSEIGKGKGVVLVGLPEGQKIKQIKLIRKEDALKFMTVSSKNKTEKEITLKAEDALGFEKGRSTKGNHLPLKDKGSEISFL